MMSPATAAGVACTPTSVLFVDGELSMKTSSEIVWQIWETQCYMHWSGFIEAFTSSKSFIDSGELTYWYQNMFVCRYIKSGIIILSHNTKYSVRW